MYIHQKYKVKLIKQKNYLVFTIMVDLIGLLYSKNTRCYQKDKLKLLSLFIQK